MSAMEAVITASPFAMPVISPFSSTEAVSVSELLHVMVLS